MGDYMRNNNKPSDEENAKLLSIFTENLSIEETTRILGEVLSNLCSAEYIAFGCVLNPTDTSFKELAFWDTVGRDRSDIKESLDGNIQGLVCALNARDYIDADTFKKLICLPNNQEGLLAFAIKYDNQLIGFLFTQIAKEKQTAGVIEGLCDMSKALGAPLAASMTKESERLGSYVFNAILDRMKSSVYITDAETDKILFMNQAMKEEYGLEKPEGQICWKVLQRGMTEHCSFCPIEKLRDSAENHYVYQWNECSSVTGRSYQKYDSLIEWIDGRMVHLQQTIDFADIVSAYPDELAQLMPRTQGKKALARTIKDVEINGVSVTICLYDINMLKAINEDKGRNVGDRLIYLVTTAVKNHLREGEYTFRLSSDEFVAVFNTELKATQQRLESINTELEKAEIEHYGFSFGLVELEPYEMITVDDVLFIADERMYEQKRRFRVVSKEEQRLDAMYLTATTDNEFVFDSDLLYDAIVQSTENYLFVCNMKTGVIKFSHAMKEDFALPEDVEADAIAVWGEKIHEQDRKAFQEAFQLLLEGRTTNHCVEYRVKNNKEQWIWVRCRGHLEYDKSGNAALFAGFITNLDKKNQIDNLTGLYNKIVFKEKIEFLSQSEDIDQFAMMIIGIDDLKHINGLYNRSFGDEVIRIVSQRIQSLSPHTATVYRLDGDEFGVIVKSANSVQMQSVYNRIAQNFKYQQEYDGKKYYCSLSAGIVQYPQDGTNYLDLLKYASYSLEHSKTHGKKRCTLFSKEILELRSRSLGMVEALRESVENNFAGFSLVYQPLVNAASGELCGVEALARWEHADFGKVSPIEFIPLLEQTGLIEAVGKWVLSTAVSTCKNWLEVWSDLVVDVNLSYKQLSNDSFIAFVSDALQQSGYPSSNLVLELTESQFANDNSFVQKVFEEIRALGIKVAMDDFGTGYSSLGILKESPADMVKIDKTFVRDIRSSHFDSTFIQFVVALCHDVGIKVCLEGVETDEQYQVVKEMKLDFIQGYLFDKPLSEAEFTQKYIATVR